jgi:2'-5' RNA ligase
VRAFVALYPDEEARSRIADVAPDDDGAWRVSDMADWHVTLRFLGELDASGLDLVARALVPALASMDPFTVRLGPITALGTSARVLFVPADGAQDAARAVDLAVGDLAEPRDRPFRGHLTIARARGRGRLPGGWTGQPIHADFSASEAALVVSRLEPARAVHRVVARFAFGEGIRQGEQVFV